MVFSKTNRKSLNYFFNDPHKITQHWNTHFLGNVKEVYVKIGSYKKEKDKRWSVLGLLYTFLLVFIFVKLKDIYLDVLGLFKTIK